MDEFSFSDHKEYKDSQAGTFSITIVMITC